MKRVSGIGLNLDLCQMLIPETDGRVQQTAASFSWFRVYRRLVGYIQYVLAAGSILFVTTKQQVQ